MERKRFFAKGYVHITNSKQRKHLSPSARCAGTSKGVFVTTSDFTNTAKDYVARSPKRIVLIDGKALARLMVTHDIGVRRKVIDVSPSPVDCR